MRIILIALALTLVFSYESLDDIEMRKFFEKISEQKFGQTIIETIQIELNDGENSLERTLDMLKQMKADGEAEQKQADATYKERQKTCENNLAVIDEQIQKSSQKKAQDVQQRLKKINSINYQIVPLKEEEIEDKKRQSEDKTAEANRNKDRLDLVQNDRAEVREKYEKRRNDLLSIITGLRETRLIINESGQENSFMQITDSVMQELEQHLNNIVKKNLKKNGYGLLTTLLLETAQDDAVRADQKLINILCETIDHLVDELYSNQKEELLADDASEAAYQIIKTRLEEESKVLIQEVSELTASIEMLLQKRLELMNDIATQQQQVDNKKSEKDDWTKTCDDERRGYEKQTNNRQEELSIIIQAIDILVKNGPKKSRSVLTQMKVL